MKALSTMRLEPKWSGERIEARAGFTQSVGSVQAVKSDNPCEEAF